MTIRSVVGAVALLALTAPAQSPAILGPSNAAFVEGLWRVNYIQEALRVAELVAASTLPDSEKKAVELIHTRLQIALKTQSGDAVGRRDLVLKGLEDKATQLKAADLKSEAASILVGEWIDQFRLLADAMVEALAQEQDPEKVAGLRKDAETVFKAAVTDLEQRKAECEKIRSDEVPGSEIPLLVAFYGLGRLHYYHSLIHPADSLHAKHHVEVSLDTLEEFDLDFSDSLAAFEAKLTQALCHQRLGNIEGALAACDEGIALRERFDRNKDGVYPVDKDAADVIAAASLQKSLFLQDQKDWAKVVVVAKDFFATIPQPLEAAQGPALLAAMANAHVQLGENEVATKEAQQLVDMGGQWGRKGQELLGLLLSNSGPSGSGVDPSKLLRSAETLALQGDYDQALRLCRTVQLNAAAADDKLVIESILITGAIFATREWYHEASVAFDDLVRRFPKSEQAPDALWRSVQCFVKLDESPQMPMFKRLIDERSKQLVRDYPNDVRVGSLQLLDGERMERAQNYLAAVKVYESIQSNSSVYLEARERAATCNLRHGRSLANGGQTKEAEVFTTKALSGFESLLRDIDNTRPQTVDKAGLARLDLSEFKTRVALANLFLTGQPKRPADAETVLAKLNLADGDPQAPVVWALKIRTRLVQGAIDEAASAMEAALEKAPTSKQLLSTCRSLATELDNMAVERNKLKERQAAAAIWRRATTFYLKSAGTEGATSAEVLQIADRLRVIGMINNNLDEKIESWVEVPQFKAGNSEAWVGAVHIYRRLSEANELPYKGQIGYARLLGFQGNWNDCENELAKVFAKERVLGANRRLDPTVLSKKPDLLTAYLEWGYALLAATTGDAKARRASATDIFDRLFMGVPEDSRHWWHARFGQIQSLFDRGQYEPANISLNSLERRNPDFDGDRFGLKVRFRTLRLAINDKLPK